LVSIMKAIASKCAAEAIVAVAFRSPGSSMSAKQKAIAVFVVRLAGSDQPIDGRGRLLSLISPIDAGGSVRG